MSLLKFNFTRQAKTLNFALPMMAAQLMWALGPFANTFLAAKLDPYSLAAIGLINTMFFTLCSMGWGMLAPVGILAAHYYGANEKDKLAQILQQGFCLSLLLSIPIFLLMWYAPSILLFLGQSPRVVALTVTNFHLFAIMIPSMYILSMLTEFLVGIGKTRVILLLSLIELPLNLCLKYLFMFGKLGFPRLGLIGIGWGVLLLDWLLFFIYISYTLFYKDHRQYHLWRWRHQNWRHLTKIIHIGWPIAISFMLEIGFFTAITLLVGKIGAETLAANQIALQFLTFLAAMFFGLGQATTSLAAQTLGKNSQHLAKEYSFSGLQIALYLVCFIIIIFIWCPHLLIGIDLNLHDPNNQTIIHMAATFLRITAFFVLFDSFRIVLSAILRAYKDTHFSMYVTSIGFWGIGLVLAYLLAFTFKLGIYGLWTGLIIGGAVGTILLCWRFLLVL
jgi:MATE family multidrug resistance protein